MFVRTGSWGNELACDVVKERKARAEMLRKSCATGEPDVVPAPGGDGRVSYSSLSCFLPRSRTSVFMPTSLRFSFSSALPVSK